jgi:serine/threonine protein kinase
MIDHIIGAVYFLHHFDVAHSALRPQQILVDEDGRFVLVDREAFARKSNYQLALEFIEAKENGTSADAEVLNYLAPEYLPNLKNNVEEPSVDQ